MANGSKVDQQDNLALDNINRQLVENQSFLHNENVKSQDDVSRLSKQLETLRKSTINPEIFEALRKERESLLALNYTLKNKIQKMKSSPTPLSSFDIERENKEKVELSKAIQDLDHVLEKIKQSEKLDIKDPNENITKTVEVLLKKLDEQEKKYEEANEIIRKLREDDEKYVLRERINDMKQLITDLEVENTKLKFESEQLSEDVENYKKQLNDTVEEAKESAKKCYHLEDEKDKLKEIVSQLENDKIKLKKEMIEEMNEANRAKRVSVDTEIALQHISEAYESKRQEVMALQKQLDEAENIIRNFKQHLERENLKIM